jgi:SAM-dependent methyltransferase
VQTPKPHLISKNADAVCDLCDNAEGIWKIHYPEYTYRVGDFEAPPWFAHDKYYCPSCHFLWADVFKDMDLVEYGEKYVENNYDHQRRPTESRMQFAPLLISKLVRLTGGNRFLDYGCGYNYTYVYELRSRGIDLWGCDISAAVNYSRYIRRLPFESFPDDFFDGIFSIDVMEHISDFENDFREMARFLKPGCYMLHNTIALDRYWRDDDVVPDDPMVWAPWHCSVFSERSGRVLAEKVGLGFEGIIPVRSDTGIAFLFRKPGPTPARRFNLLGKAWKLWRLMTYMPYFRKNYIRAITLPGSEKKDIGYRQDVRRRKE